VSTIEIANVNVGPGLAIGADGLGFVTYASPITGALRAAHCNDVACTSATVTTVDPTNLMGNPSVAIGADGLPLIVYARGDLTQGQLASAHCSNAGCSAATISVLGPLFGVDGRDTAVAIGADGLGLIALSRAWGGPPGPDSIIRMAHCVDALCTALTPPATERRGGDVPLAGMTHLRRPALLVGTDGRGLVSYRRDFVSVVPGVHTHEIVVQHCASTSCASFDSIRLFPITDDDGPNAPLATGASGLPRLVRAQNHKLRVAQCADVTCATSTDSCVLARGLDTALARGTDGLPLVAFFASPDADLGVAHGSGPCPLSVANVDSLTIDEGDVLSFQSFQVRLDTPPDETATVHFETADGTAQAGSDYDAVSATLTFQPGQASQSVSLPIRGDTLHESDEVFRAVLSDPQGLVIGDGDADVTLTNDDAPPAVILLDCSVTEGDSGNVGCQLQAQLTTPSGLPASVDFTTASGAAQAGVDFLPASGTLSFAPGTTTQPVSVSVVGDMAVELDENFFVNLSNPVNATIGDGQAEGFIVDDDAPSLSSLELTHGARVRADLAAAPGPLADQDLYRLAQGPYSSWEVVLDEVSGDVAPGLVLERLAEDNGTVLQTGTPVGTGSARAIRWQRRSATPEVRHHIRVRSTSCTTDCGTDDTYRLRVFETTGRIPRFNNAGTQVTVLILQNTTDQAIQANADFWDASGALRATMTLPLGPHAIGVLSVSSVQGLAGLSGSITVTHDGLYGGLVGKAVALEPSTGFSFDSPMVSKPR
jgi:hypothetical protein